MQYSVKFIESNSTDLVADCIHSISKLNYIYKLDEYINISSDNLGCSKIHLQLNFDENITWLHFILYSEFNIGIVACEEHFGDELRWLSREDNAYLCAKAALSNRMTV